MKLRFRTSAVALLAGAALALAFPTWRLHVLAWVALVPVFYLAAKATPLGGFWTFLTAGLMFHLVLLQWLLTNTYWAGGWAVWGYAALSLLMALYWGLFGFLWTWGRRRARLFPSALAAAVLWATMEFLQASLFTGFGWGSLAYSQGRVPNVIQWAAVGGAFLVSAIVAGFNALVAEMLAEPRHRVLKTAFAVALVAGSIGGGRFLLDEADYDTSPFRVGILQSNFPLEMKWDPEYAVEMARSAAQKSRRMYEAEPVDVFVWPESLIMAPIDAPEMQEAVSTLTAQAKCPLFTGATRYGETSGKPRNASCLVDADGVVLGYYDKVHLAPFGEYVPLGAYLPFIRRVVPAISDIEPGERQRTFAVGQRRADFLVVITNLGWFGESNAIPQELEIARVRAIETRLPLVHCANTGISGVFDPWGRFTPARGVVAQTGSFARIRQDVPPERLIRRRLVDALPVAQAGSRPIPLGPTVFPWIALGLSSVFIAGALFISPPQREPIFKIEPRTKRRKPMNG